MFLSSRELALLLLLCGPLALAGMAGWWCTLSLLCGAAHPVSGVLALVLLLRWLCAHPLRERGCGASGRDDSGEQALHSAAGPLLCSQHTRKLLLLCGS